MQVGTERTAKRASGSSSSDLPSQAGEKDNKPNICVRGPDIPIYPLAARAKRKMNWGRRKGVRGGLPENSALRQIPGVVREGVCGRSGGSWGKGAAWGGRTMWILG